MTYYEAGLGAALAAILIAIAVSDWRSFRIPDRLTGLALGLRAADLLVAPNGPLWQAFLGSALRAGAMAGLFYLFRAAYRRWRGREGLGLGDVKLAAVAGAWIDWPWLAPVVEIAALLGLALAIFKALRTRERLGAHTRLPFGVGFSVAIFMGWEMQRLAL